jgi:hypothetical protein
MVRAVMNRLGWVVLLLKGFGITMGLYLAVAMLLFAVFKLTGP